MIYEIAMSWRVKTCNKDIIVSHLGSNHMRHMMSSFCFCFCFFFLFLFFSFLLLEKNWRWEFRFMNESQFAFDNLASHPVVRRDAQTRRVWVPCLTWPKGGNANDDDCVLSRCVAVYYDCHYVAIVNYYRALSVAASVSVCCCCCPPKMCVTVKVPRTWKPHLAPPPLSAVQYTYRYFQSILLLCR